MTGAQRGCAIPFAKLQGAGNGYVVIDGRELEIDWPELARAIAAPHFGVGSDGVAVVQRSQIAPLRMRIFNSDGSEAEMSGNGLRLFAKFVLDRGLAALADGELRVETSAGLRSVWPRFGDGTADAHSRARMRSGRVGMGVPDFDPAALPVDPGLLASSGAAEGRLVEHPLDVDGRRIRVTCLSLGNPHAVALLEESIDTFPLEQIGPAVQGHPMFPRRVNFEIANVVARDRMRARIFERGEGETLASGTGSTACVVAARLQGRVEAEVAVALRGGELRVRWRGEGHAAELDGPAVEVFAGEWYWKG